MLLSGLILCYAWDFLMPQSSLRETVRNVQYRIKLCVPPVSGQRRKLKIEKARKPLNCRMIKDLRLFFNEDAYKEFKVRLLANWRKLGKPNNHALVRKERKMPEICVTNYIFVKHEGWYNWGHNTHCADFSTPWQQWVGSQKLWQLFPTLCCSCLPPVS